MIPLLTLICGMGATLAIGARRWRRTSTKYYLLSVVALIQTCLILLDMFTMQIPKF